MNLFPWQFLHQSSNVHAFSLIILPCVSFFLSENKLILSLNNPVVEKQALLLQEQYSYTDVEIKICTIMSLYIYNSCKYM